MNPASFPEPQIPPAALLGNLRIQPSGVHRKFPSILDVKHSRFTTSGRASIALALEHAGISKNDEILVPAYHCEAMVAPAKWRRASVVFYKINRDTRVNIDDIRRKITNRTRVVLVTHYFGFEQPLSEIKQLCSEKNLILIEDCAHAMFGLASDRPIGTTGDYAIGSCMKFLPIYEGGMICSQSHSLDNLVLSKPSIKFQIKSAFNIFEIALRYQRFGGILNGSMRLFFKFKDAVWNRLKKSQLVYDGNKLGPSSSEGGFGLDENWIYKEMSWFSRKVILSSNLDEIAQKRRDNYQSLCSVFNQFDICRPLFDILPEHTVPWVVPIYVDQPEKYFTLLKMQGMPVWRFGEFLDPMVTADVCSVSTEYSKHIFQFPCHQSLTPNEIDWMIHKITEIFSAK